MMMQERIAEKWKNEHKSTVEFFERQVKNLKVENRNLQEKIIELKGLIRLEKENTDDQNIRKKKTSEKSREREEVKRTSSKTK